MSKFVKANSLDRLRQVMQDRVLTPRQLSQLKGGTGNPNPLPPAAGITEDFMDL